MSETFTISSEGARLVEVDGSGPYSDRPGGVSVADGVPTIAPVHLLTEYVRRWRVDAVPSVQARVKVTDSPFGVFVGVRRCVASRRAGWLNRLTVRWPWVGVTNGRASTLRALWNLLTGEAQACTWRDVGDNLGDEVIASGGDVVVAIFGVP